MGVGKVADNKGEEKQAEPTPEAAGEFSELEARLNNLRRD